MGEMGGWAKTKDLSDGGRSEGAPGIDPPV